MTDVQSPLSRVPCGIDYHKWEYRKDKKYERTIRVCTECGTTQCPVHARETFHWVRCELTEESL